MSNDDFHDRNSNTYIQKYYLLTLLSYESLELATKYVGLKVWSWEVWSRVLAVGNCRVPSKQSEMADQTPVPVASIHTHCLLFYLPRALASLMDSKDNATAHF